MVKQSSSCQQQGRLTGSELYSNEVYQWLSLDMLLRPFPSVTVEQSTNYSEISFRRHYAVKLALTFQCATKRTSALSTPIPHATVPQTTCTSPAWTGTMVPAAALVAADTLCRQTSAMHTCNPLIVHISSLWLRQTSMKASCKDALCA
jgi:hypothetical protein